MVSYIHVSYTIEAEKTSQFLSLTIGNGRECFVFRFSREHECTVCNEFGNKKVTAQHLL